MRRLLPLALACGLIGAACARRAEEPPVPEPVPVVDVEPVPNTAPSAAPRVPVSDPGPPPVAPEPLPVSPGRANGIGKRVVIDGLAVWVEAVEYKRTTSRLKTGDVRKGAHRRFVISFGVQSADPAQTFVYNTWARYHGTMLVRDALGRGWGMAGADEGPTHGGNVTFAIVEFDKPVIDEMIFIGRYVKVNPPGSAEPHTPIFTAYYDIDLPRPPAPFDESRMYRFRVHAPEVN